MAVRIFTKNNTYLYPDSPAENILLCLVYLTFSLFPYICVHSIFFLNSCKSVANIMACHP